MKLVAVSDLKSGDSERVVRVRISLGVQTFCIMKTYQLEITAGNCMWNAGLESIEVFKFKPNRENPEYEERDAEIWPKDDDEYVIIKKSDLEKLTL